MELRGFGDRRFGRRKSNSPASITGVNRIAKECDSRVRERAKGRQTDRAFSHTGDYGVMGWVALPALNPETR